MLGVKLGQVTSACGIAIEVLVPTSGVADKPVIGVVAREGPRPNQVALTQTRQSAVKAGTRVVSDCVQVIAKLEKGPLFSPALACTVPHPPQNHTVIPSGTQSTHSLHSHAHCYRSIASNILQPFSTCPLLLLPTLACLCSNHFAAHFDNIAPATRLLFAETFRPSCQIVKEAINKQHTRVLRFSCTSATFLFT